MSAAKMYTVKPMIKLPKLVELSEFMYKKDSFFRLPENVRETYYDDQIPVFKSDTQKNTMVADPPFNTAMDKLKSRQEAVLENLKQIKERLEMVKDYQFPSTCSSLNFDALTVAHQIQGLYFIRKIDALKHYLLDAKRMRNHLEQSVEQMERWQEFVLKQLLSLRDEMKVMAEQNNAACEIKREEDVKSRQKSILEIIEALQALLKNEMTSFQTDLKDDLFQLNVEEYHTEVLKLIEGLQEEFETVLRAMNWPPMEVVKHHCQCQDNFITNDMEFGDLSFNPTINMEPANTRKSRPELAKSIETSGTIHDIVVSTNPSNPPYFLLPLKKIMQPNMRILSTSTVHSSVDHIDPNVVRWFNDDEAEERANYNISFTVIWKNQTMKTLMVDPLKQCLIAGEANILRYFSRILPAISPLNYESQGSFALVSETDFWLDTIQSKFLHGGNKERQSFLKHMNSKLGASTWMDGNNYGLCDIFCWSVILQLRLEAGLPSNVSSWFKKITETFHLDEVVDNEELANQSPGEINGDESCTNHVNRKGLEDFLQKNGIHFQSRNHKEVFTVDALMECVKDMPGIHMKNLFLKDKKKNLYLLAARHDVEVKLNDVGNQIGAKDMRFGDENTLFETLGVKQGCVTLYALLNDPSHKVTLLLDAEVLKTTQSFINFHPMTNDATLGISPQDLQKFIKLTGHKMQLINL